MLNKKSYCALLSLLLTPAAQAAWSDFCTTIKTGPSTEYTRIKQGCLPHQSGAMIGPVGSIFFEHDSGLNILSRFKALFDIPHICSNNGITVKAKKYEYNNHCGYRCGCDEDCYTLTPFTGIDFIYLRHAITNDIMINRYYQINVPFGCNIQHNISESVHWGLKIYYDLDVWSRLKICTPELNDTSETKINLKRGDRVAVEVPFSWNFSLCNYKCFLDYTLLFNWQKFKKEACPTDLTILELKQWHIGSMINFGIQF